MPRSSPVAAPALARIAPVLWPDGTGGHRLVAEPGGAAVGESYLVLPHLRRPRFLLPLDAGPAARTRLLLRYNHLRRDRRRIVRALLAGPVRLGLPRPRPGHNVAFVEASTRSLLDVVAEQLGTVGERLVLSTGIRAQTGPARPTLNITDDQGRSRAFVKLAVADHHRAALEREHAFLSDFAAEPADGLLVPRPLFRTEWEGALVVGVAALPDDVRRVRPRHFERTLPFLAKLVASRPRRQLALVESPWLAELRATSASLPEPWRTRALEAVGRTERRDGHQLVEHTVRHGDWSPWNMAWTGDARLALWDWEFAQELAPRGLDEWNWQYAHDTSVRRLPVPVAAERLRAAARSAGGERAALVVELMLLDMALRRAGQAAVGNQSSARYADDLFATLAGTR
jgi:hypothetical protein